jgi:hypothetical protein
MHEEYLRFPDTPSFSLHFVHNSHWDFAACPLSNAIIQAMQCFTFLAKRRIPLDSHLHILSKKQ